MRCDALKNRAVRLLLAAAAVGAAAPTAGAAVRRSMPAVERPKPSRPEAVADDPNGRGDDPAACSRLQKMVEEAVPSAVGDPAFVARLLNPRVDPLQLSQRLNPAAAAEAVGDKLKCECLPGEGKKTTCEGEQGRFSIDLGRGRVAYQNPARHFDPLKDPENSVKPEAGLELARRAALAFGVPPSELGDGSVRVLNVAGLSDDSRQRLVKAAEIVALLPRHVDGIPVLNSGLRGAVDRESQIARLRLRWPDFKLAASLATQRPVPRANVVGQILRTIQGAGSCGFAGGVRADVAYVPVRHLQSSEEEDAGPGEPGPAAGEDLIPALVVTEIPAEAPEDSGQLQNAGIEHIVPLFEAVAAGDLRSGPAGPAKPAADDDERRQP